MVWLATAMAYAVTVDGDSEEYATIQEAIDAADRDCDADHDGFGDPREPFVACAHEASDAYVQDRNDCDDSDPDINPDAEEIPNDHVDQDCDGMDLFAGAAGGCACDDLGHGGRSIWVIASIAGLLLRRRAARIAPG
jgi:hypothetical protein